MTVRGTTTAVSIQQAHREVQALPCRSSEIPASAELVREAELLKHCPYKGLETVKTNLI